jgi:MFS family permease
MSLPRGFGGYGVTFGRREFRRLVAGMLVNGPSLGVPLALVLAVTRYGTYAEAGAVVAANATFLAISSPIRGRMVDRFDRRWVLLTLAGFHATVLVCLGVAVTQHLPIGLIAALAAGAGAPAPLLSSMRVATAQLFADSADVEPAYVVQSTLNELLYVVAPVSVSLTVSLWSPAGVMYVLAACHLGGTIVFLSAEVNTATQTPRGRQRVLGALRSAGMRTVVAVNVPLGMIFGVLYVAVPAFAAERHAVTAAGLMLAALSAGSVAGGLLYGGLKWPSPAWEKLRRLLAIQVLILLPLALADSMWMLGVLLFLGGALVAPLVAVHFTLVDLVAPAGTGAEATSWIVTAYTVGVALGSSIGGAILSTAGTTPAFASVGALAVIAFLAARARWHTLVAVAPLL